MKSGPTRKAPQSRVTDRQRAILNALAAHVALIGPDGAILEVNESWRRFADANAFPGPDAGVGQNYLEICDHASGEGSEQIRAAGSGIRRVLRGETEEFSLEYPCHSPGEHRWFRLTATPLKSARQNGAVVMHVNITERVLAEQKLHRLSRLYQVLSRTNEEAVHATRPGPLFEAVCEIAVEQGQFRMAAVFAVDGKTGNVLPLTHAGTEDGYLSEISVKAFDGELSRGTIGTAIRSGRHDFCNDFANDPRMRVWRESALRRGYHSAASFPITQEGKVTGALVLFAGEINYFQEDELKLLTAVAEDVSFAVEALARKEQRLQAELALRASEASMAAAQRIAHFGSWELALTKPDDLDANPVRWSNETFRIMGYEPGAVEVSNALFFRHIPPDEHERVRQAITAAIRERRQYSLTHHLIRSNGEKRIVQETAQVFCNDAGQPLKIVGTMHDITERKQAEDERDRLFNLSLDMLCVANFKGWLVQVNPAWTKCLGWTAEELTSRPMQEFILSEDHEATSQTRARIHQGTSVTGFENRYRCKNGGFRWLSWAVHPLMETRQVFAVARDVTEQKEAEERITEQAALLDKAQDAILVRDLENRILYWNKSAERLYGWSAAEAIGRSLYELVYRDRTAFETASKRLMEAGDWSGEMAQVTRDGRELTVEGRWTLVRDAAGRPKSVLAINTDVTQRKKLESQFLRAQRIESIGALASGIAHDLNNVLAPILMSVQMLKETVQDQESLALLATVQGSAQRGADLVKQVLSFARGVEGSRASVNPVHILRDIQKIIRDTFPKNIECTLQPPGTVWTVNGDPTQLHQVFMNLCVNSRDAMPGGGRLRLTMDNVILDDVYSVMDGDSKPGPYIKVSVEDTGQGIAPDLINRIFDPFFTTKEVGKGTGLGLATARTIVESHGGFFKVYSEPGRGSKFTVFLPASVPARQTEFVGRDSGDLPRGKGELILIVDDEESIRTVAKKVLESFGYRVMTAPNGAEAVALYVQHHPEIAAVLTDMAMPVMDGAAVIVALKAINPAVKIIGSSGLTREGNLPSPASSGLAEFVPKPYTARALLAAIHKVLQQS